VQNPVANLISVPLQNNTTYNIGPHERAANTLNIQPVIPFHLSEEVLLISRTIIPIVYQPDLGSTGGGSSGYRHRLLISLQVERRIAEDGVHDLGNVHSLWVTGQGQSIRPQLLEQAPVDEP
jgi:hypothetical protein